ncbi:hypothetical protein DBV15_08323 [Temnothorax longispinosus]|uniref:Uncharacterized protein n=1 Tax=Temnothorax longispinosus TaxID=300112 RepID=A0A4S2L4V4_9HYME|nr:hypothetical protein DBV15_08323 [Temnothorax longispinosus]
MKVLDWRAIFVRKPPRKKSPAKVDDHAIDPPRALQSA